MKEVEKTIILPDAKLKWNLNFWQFYSCKLFYS